MMKKLIRQLEPDAARGLTPLFVLLCIAIAAAGWAVWMTCSLHSSPAEIDYAGSGCYFELADDHQTVILKSGSGQTIETYTQSTEPLETNLLFDPTYVPRCATSDGSRESSIMLSYSPGNGVTYWFDEDGVIGAAAFFQGRPCVAFYEVIDRDWNEHCPLSRAELGLVESPATEKEGHVTFNVTSYFKAAFK